MARGELAMLRQAHEVFMTLLTRVRGSREDVIDMTDLIALHDEVDEVTGAERG